MSLAPPALGRRALAAAPRGPAALRAAPALLAVLAANAVLAGCDGGSSHRSQAASTAATAAQAVSTVSPAPPSTSVPQAPRRPPGRPPRPPGAPGPPRLVAAALTLLPTRLAPAVRWRGRVAGWVSRSPAGVAVLVFDQHLAELHLHSGTVDAGAAGWRWGPAVAASERRRLVGAFNGGFRLNTGAGGFASYGRVAVAVRPGLASIVTYADGRSDVGSWGSELPARGKRVLSVRQNLMLLIDHGHGAGNLDCNACWGATLGGVVDPARSALGITADGRLVWAGGEHLTLPELVGSLLGVGVVRAAELDINPEWVAAYLYGHRVPSSPAPVQVVPGQPGVPGQFLAPYSRDFFTVVAH